MENNKLLNRWRLILGKNANEELELSEQYMQIEECLSFLYEGHEDSEDKRKGAGGKEKSKLTVPDWVGNVKKLFPKESAKILEKHAIEKYELKELLTNKEILENLEPNKELLKSILSFKKMMSEEVLETAKKIVKKIVDELKETMRSEIKSSVSGKLDKLTSGVIKSPSNLNVKKTIRKNLKNYNKEEQMIMVDKVYFYNRVKRYNPYEIIIAVDESGSMLDSVIHTAIMSSIFYSLPQFKTKLIIFDTEVVDLTDRIEDPVETLMKVQLGGGTHIAKALAYCESKIENPNKSIVVLVTDLYEGYGLSNLYAKCKDIIEGGSKLIILPSLDYEVNGVYDKKAAKVLANMGAHVLETTPEGLVNLICQIV